MGCCDKERIMSGGLNYGKIPDYWIKRGLGTSVQKALKGDNTNGSIRFVRSGLATRNKR